MIKAAKSCPLWALLFGILAGQGSWAETATGKKHFFSCSACHAMRADAPAMFGPHLEGIVGRKAGGLADYSYTTAVQEMAFVWDEQQLDQWLEKPQAMIPGMCMPFRGLPDAKARQLLIDYLKNPQP